jgi:hypothetical protein
MKAERQALLRINAPEWYARPDFRAWLNNPERATWHRIGKEPNEYSDVFITFDHGEGSDFDVDMPDDVWAQITQAAADAGIQDCVVWISNLEEQ